MQERLESECGGWRLGANLVIVLETYHIISVLRL